MPSPVFRGLRSRSLQETSSLPTVLRWTRCLGLGWVRSEAWTLSRRRCAQGRDRRQNSSVHLAMLPEAKITIHSHCPSTQPRWHGAGSQSVKKVLSPPQPPPQSLGSSQGLVGISFAAEGPTKLIGFSGCPQVPVRVLQRRDKDRGLERWVMCSWLVLCPPPPWTSQDLRVWLREEDPPGEPLWSPPPLAGGGEAQTGGLRSQPQCSVTKGRPELGAFYSVPAVWARARWETPGIQARPRTGEQ